MKAYSSGYTRRFQHFVIQNLDPRAEPSRWTPLVKVALNLLQRGNPTPMPPTLREELGISTLDTADIGDVLPATLPQWTHTIRGDDDRDHNPASVFFHRRLPEALGQDQHLMWLIRPEVSFDEILQTSEPALAQQQADFYCPAAHLVIEIDGSQHRTNRAQFAKDALRQKRLDKAGIALFRLRAGDIEDPRWPTSAEALALVEKIRQAGTKRQVVREATSALDGHAAAEDVLQAVAAFRLQVTVLELLLSGQLTMEQVAWQIELRADVDPRFASPALDDLRDLLADLGRLVGMSAPPTVVLLTGGREPLTAARDVVIDISVRRRWTDEDVMAPEVIFVRSDYVDEYPDGAGGWRPVDRFCVESGDPIAFQLEQERDEPVVSQLLKRVFGHSTFKAGQWAILDNVLKRRKTVGVLPTGQGKSLCYQLPALLQPGTTVVVSPLKSLMRDQVKELESAGVARVAAINSDDRPKERERKISAFAKGRYQILLVSPERFQVEEFREACRAAAKQRSVLHAVVDEVHCLSEWGHDFRVAYLNLARTLERLFPNGLFLGLTATASSNALRDIQHEFRVRDEDVIYRLDIKRANLQFQVVLPKGQASAEISKWIAHRRQEGDDGIPCGIIFTPHVNGRKGCVRVSQEVATALNTSVKWFSGTKPSMPPMTDTEFEDAKRNAQDGFKSGSVRLLCATKAFGMGVNKPDVRFTMHLGVPASMESLYQEAGRAGRDGVDADCLVFAKLPSVDHLAAFAAPQVRLKDLKQLEKDLPEADLRDQLYLLFKSLGTLNDEYKLIRKVRQALERSQSQEVFLQASAFNPVEELTDDTKEKPKADTRGTVTADQLQRAIHRLSQLGYVTDWTIQDFINGHYRVQWTKVSDEQVEANLLNLARAYSGQKEVLTVESICEDDAEMGAVIFGKADRPRRDALILVLLHWCFAHYHYNRRQSLKSVFELCATYKSIGPEAFRSALEGFFAITRTTVTLRELIDSGLEGIHRWPEVLQLPQGTRVEAPWTVAEWNRILLPLKSMLARMLESYQSNVALDMISAMTRLLIGEYADPDGSARLQAQLSRPHWSESERDQLIQFALHAGKYADLPQRRLLAKDLLSGSPGRNRAAQVHEALQDEESARAYVEALALAASTAIERIEDGLAGR